MKNSQVNETKLRGKIDKRIDERFGGWLNDGEGLNSDF